MSVILNSDKERETTGGSRLLRRMASVFQKDRKGSQTLGGSDSAASSQVIEKCEVEVQTHKWERTIGVSTEPVVERTVGILTEVVPMVDRELLTDMRVTRDSAEGCHPDMKDQGVDIGEWNQAILRGIEAQTDSPDLSDTVFWCSGDGVQIYLFIQSLLERVEREYLTNKPSELDPLQLKAENILLRLEVDALKRQIRGSRDMPDFDSTRGSYSNRDKTMVRTLCSRTADVYRVVSEVAVTSSLAPSSFPLGQLKRGDKVLADGSGEDIMGLVRVPVLPRGWVTVCGDSGKNVFLELVGALQMLRAFLQGSSKLRLTVLGAPSAQSLQLINSLMQQGHSVLPVLPERVHRLTHLVAEAKAQGLVVTDPTMREPAALTSRSLGVPVLVSEEAPYEAVTDDTQTSPSPPQILFESLADTVLVPVVCGVSRAEFQKQVSNNNKLLAKILSPPGSTLLSLSRNWIMDGLAFPKNAVFVPASKINPCRPTAVAVDPSGLPRLTSAVEEGKVDLTNTHTILVDWPYGDQSYNAPDFINQLRSLCNANFFFLRLSAPQIGPFCELVSCEKDLPDLSAITPVDPQITLAFSDDHNTLTVTSEHPFKYLNREVESANTVVIPLSFDNECANPFKAYRSTKPAGKQMRADWRVKKVPIAVYHKRRGFKGQIYYTTKHKGWTMYRSRYD